MSPSPDLKDKRRKDLERKREDKKRRNTVASDLRNSLFRQRVREPEPEKGGAKNPFLELLEEDEDDC